MRTILFSASLLATFLVSSGSAANMLVDSTIDHWQDTGLDVTAGQYLTVDAQGQVNYSLVAYADPNGVGNFQDGTVIGGDLAPAAIIYSLVAKIGGTDALGSGTLVPEGVLGHGPGFVGSTYYEPIPVSGRLYFGFNDSQAWHDNLGTYQVRFAVPEPSSFALGACGIVAAFFARSMRGRNRRAKITDQA